MQYNLLKTELGLDMLSDWRVEEAFEPYERGKDFVTLDAWKKCREVKLFFYQRILQQLPSEEKYGLASQIRRAANSVTLNIAEGYGRFHFKEGIQFYRIARGSLYELKDALITCYDLKWIDIDLYRHGSTLIENAKATLNGYIKFVQKQLPK